MASILSRPQYVKDCSNSRWVNSLLTFMTNMHAKSGDNIILKEDDNTIVNNKEECQIFNEYFANIASSIG